MLYLLWSLLNIGAFLFFMFVCVRATRLLRDQLGLLTSVVFILGLLSFISRSDNPKDNQLTRSEPLETWVSPMKDSLDMSFFSKRVSLEKTMGPGIELRIGYGQHVSTNQDMPADASTMMTGLVSGLAWQPIVIDMQPANAPGVFAYHVSGILYWKLLGSTLYSQEKIYKGVVDAD